MRKLKADLLISVTILAVALAGCNLIQRSTQPPLPRQGMTEQIPIAGNRVLATASLAPTPTSNTKSLIPIPWEEAAPHIHLIENQIVYEEDIRNLPPGDYAVFNDEHQRLIYLSLGEEKISGTLATYPEWKNLHPVIIDGDLWVIDHFGENNVFHLENISQKKTLLIGPLCDKSIYTSPNLRWVVAICPLPENSDQESTFYEIVELQSGKFHKLWLPYGDYPKLFWLEESRFILSRVTLEGEEKWFIIDLENWVLHFPNELIDWRVVQISNDGQYVILKYLRGSGRLITQIDCITGEGECPMWIIDKELPKYRSWSPDGSLMQVSRRDFDTPWTITLYSGPEWSEDQRVIEIPRGYPFEGFWCPDSTCFFIEKGDGSEDSFIVDLDGNIEELPYTNLVGTFSLP